MILLIVILSLCGLAISAAALYEHIALSSGIDAGFSVCNISETLKCAPALSSEWASLFGIPLASYGLLFFVTFLLLAIVARSREPLWEKAAGSAMFGLSFFAALFCVFLFIISKVVIKAICPLCLGTYLVCLLLLICAWLFDRSSAWHLRLWHFLKSLGAFPVLVLGFGTENKSPAAALARVALAAFLFSAALALALPDYIINHYVLAEAEREEAVARWQVEHLDDVGLVLNAGAVASDYARGNPEAPIQLVEFSDFECPACRNIYNLLEPILQKYEGQVLFVYRNFPLDKACNPLMQNQMHLNACFAAEYARCAGEQNKFWEVVDYLINLPDLETEENPQKVHAAILDSAPQLNLDAEAIKECLASGRQKARIESDMKDARRLGISGTPAFWINGRRLRHASPEAIQAVFDHILAAEERP